MTEVEDVEPGRMQGQDSPPAANQQKTEPIPPAGSGDVPASAADRPDEEAGNAGGLGVAAGPGPREDAAGVGTFSGSGEVHEVTVPGETSAEGTSEAMEPVDGVRLTAIAPGGHADGETDNRMPPTTSF